MISERRLFKGILNLDRISLDVSLVRSHLSPAVALQHPVTGVIIGSPSESTGDPDGFGLVPIRPGNLVVPENVS